MRPALFAAAVALPLLAAAPARAADPVTVTIVAKRFEFTPKEVRLKAGQPVRIVLRSEDVTHGFFQRELGIDAEATKETPAEITLTPAKPGRYVTICDHFCGSGHGNMKMTFVVE
ncbi:cupredoxin domain-containing protein [Anaeromyxobacter paludicola]|uniref:Cytochrome oxidase subunit II copper A binding domain-containing protein n=1 Tax=Anaeromyxobacter paludicola TaxID=2918171 RepID=A0ABM7XCB3_9BACT|nr:cupredoxin domain-containing protein [Anaeromyxobacter paludicola]BDG09510.1 hypothetical protein AMPC_26230 [Anaeromyxobacter paludicola]